MRWIRSNRRSSSRGVTNLVAHRSKVGTFALSVALLAGELRTVTRGLAERDGGRPGRESGAASTLFRASAARSGD